MSIARISTATIYNTGSDQLDTLQSNLAKTQMQLSTGRKNLTPADDPIATSQALEVTQSQSVNTQFSTNRETANSSLSQVDQALSDAQTLIQNIQTLVVNAGDGSLAPADRASLATALQGNMQDLLGVANTADGTGGYLFSGFRSTTLPFTPTATGAQYQGDQGQRTLQVGASRQLTISATGSSIFEDNPTGNGTFTTAASPGNLARGGSGIISSGSVPNAGAVTGDSYAINFAVSGGVTTYTVQDTTLNKPVPASPAVPVPIPYQSGQDITFDGLQMTVTGSPANGDSFTTAPSQKQSIFTTLTNLIQTLNTTGTGSAAQASLTNGLNAANDNLNSALDNVLSVRATVGSNLKELDYLNNTGDDLNIQYATTLSNLQDVDTVATISLYTNQQTTLEAAQKSFKSLTGLSLFNYI